jgi:NhaA family Na+:H+ antiporter
MRTWARHSLAILDNEKSGGFLLLACTVASMLCANSTFGDEYQHVWHAEFLSKPVEFWINEGLMTVFFLQVGLEIERELYVGELKDFKKSLLPVLAAVGGMLIPAVIHFFFNQGNPSQRGYGIPMATDIAFSLGFLSLLGNRVPFSLKIFLTALAIIDDLGAVLVIAIFYSTHLSVLYIGLALVIFVLLITLNRMNVFKLQYYLLLGCGMWFCLYRSGVHPTIAGVLLAFAIPFRQGTQDTSSSRLQHLLHKPVSFIVLPLFALANTAILIPSSVMSDLLSLNALGIVIGLVVGKPIGILIFSWIGLTLGWCVLPHTLKLKHILSAGMLAGIGFTMSIFVTLLAFSTNDLIDGSKIAVLTGSTISGVLGLIVMSMSLRKK